MPEKRLFVDDVAMVVQTVLLTAVANTGTVDIPYPSGYTQADFQSGLLRPTGAFVIVGGNDKWTQADGKISISAGASAITVTNSSAVTWAAGSTIILSVDLSDPWPVTVLPFHYNLADIANGAILSGFTPGIVGYLESVDAHVMKAASTAAKLATITPQIDGVNVTGGVLSMTTANMTPIGAKLAGSAITGANTLTRKSSINLIASAVTAFAEGEASIYLRIRRTG